MRQQGFSAFPKMGRRGSPLPCSVHACYRAIRGRPSFELRWISARQIERAIDNLKRSDWDKWFRKEWYKAGARRMWPAKQHNRWTPQPTGRCPAWR